MPSNAAGPMHSDKSFHAITDVLALRAKVITFSGTIVYRFFRVDQCKSSLEKPDNHTAMVKACYW